MIKRFQSYELVFAAIAANGGSGQANFLVETAYDFWWTKAQAFVYDSTNAPVAQPLATCILQAGSTAQQLMQSEVSVSNIFGTGQLPFILPAMHKIEGGTNFLATVYNRHPTAIYTVKLAFSGVIVAHGQSLQRAAR